MSKSTENQARVDDESGCGGSGGDNNNNNDSGGGAGGGDAVKHQRRHGSCHSLGLVPFPANSIINNKSAYSLMSASPSSLSSASASASIASLQCGATPVAVGSSETTLVAAGSVSSVVTDHEKVSSSISNDIAIPQPAVLKWFPDDTPGLYALDDGWEEQVFEDKRYDSWRKVMLESLIIKYQEQPQQQQQQQQYNCVYDYPLVLPPELGVLLMDDEAVNVTSSATTTPVKQTPTTTL